MTVKHKLAAIMFTDVVGYTAMMQHDKELAVRTIKYHQEMLEECLKIHDGKLIQYYGDGSLTLFPAATDAIECAISLQLRFRESDDPKVPLRIGLHLGEVTMDGDEVYGDGVNLASRIESLGVAGSILFSDSVYQSIRNNPKFRIDSLGLFEFKNVDKPMEVFALVNEGFPLINKKELSGKLKPQTKKRSLRYVAFSILVALVAFLYFRPDEQQENGPGDISEAFLLQKPSIVILPFEIYGADSSNEHIAEGIADEIRYQLHSLSDLKVISRSSSRSYKNKQMTSKAIGEELNVAYILEGAVHQSGEAIKINAQLINTRTDNIELSFQPDQGDARNIYQLESTIAREIAQQLQLKLSDAELRSLTKAPTDNYEAYEHFKKGQMLLLRGVGKTEVLDEAMKNFKKAIQLDSSFARAYVGLCDTYLEYVYWGRRPSREVLDPALDAAMKALELDSDNGACYGALGAINFYRLEKQTSTSYLMKGMELSPNYVGTYEKLAWIRLNEQDLDGALEMFAKARELDPLSTKFVGDIGAAYYYSGKFDEGIRHIKQNLERFPDDNFLRWILGYLYSGAGDYEKAIDAFTGRSVASNTNWMLGYSYAMSGNRGEAERILQYQLEKRKTTHVPAYMIATIYIGLGDTENALKWLETDYEEGGQDLFFWCLNSDPKFTSVSSDPRFKAILNKIR